VNDGQHRIEAIKQAFKEKPELKYETISAIFYYDAGLKNSQQIFTDLNRYTVKPTPSISILYDSRDTLADLTRYLADNVYYFKDLTEYEKTSISNRSIYMFTLNGIYNSTKELLSKKSKFDILDENEKELAKEYWTILGDNIYEWSLIKNGKTTSKYLRDNFIHSHNLFLYVMGRIGNYLIQNRMNFKNYLEKLSNINWSRKNQEWEGIALNNGRLSKSKINIDNTYNFIMNKLEITKCFKSEVVDNVFN
jgi:DNA sulfur modification protein DndB